MEFIGKILPVEGYYVRIKEKPPIDYLKSLTHLYQPLIGMESIMLYQTLLNEIDFQDGSTSQTHHTLMNYLNIPLDDIYEARLKLEGIGLLKTFKIKDHESSQYIYELQSPFTPENFFKDAMFSELLYHHLGQDKYDFLKRKYTRNPSKVLEDEITTSFSEVFQTFHPTFDNIDQVTSKSEEFDEKVVQIDFSWIESVLKQRMIPGNKVLTKMNKKLISEMMFLYDLAPHEIEKSLLWALTDENILDVDEFKKACHDLFKTKHHQLPIALNVKKQDPTNQEETKRPQTKQEQLIQRLETISPKHLLEDLSSGNQASAQDMKIIQEVMLSQGLPAPVMNVLIHYVLLQSNMKLSKAYMEKIASHWSRANLKTAREAMEFAKKEIAKHEQGAANRNNYRKQVSNEIIPDWFKDRNKEQPEESTEQYNPVSEKEKEEIDALLKLYAGE